MKDLQKLKESLFSIESRSLWEYKQMYRNQARDLPLDVFKEEVFDYEKAFYLENRGIAKAREMVLKLVEERNFSDFKEFLLQAINLLEDYLNECKCKPYPADESIFAYQDGIRKVLEKLKEFGV